jgi:chemotaxis methyl-accepting protein methylase
MQCRRKEGSEYNIGMREAQDVAQEKIMLRVYSGEQKGATAFFRNRSLLRTLTQLLEPSAHHPPRTLRILFHSASIGAEPYSFAIWCQMHGLHRRLALEILATDINSEFLDFARNARYSANVLQMMSEEERAYFEQVGENQVTPVETIRRMVAFLPAMSFLEPMAATFDVVMVLNALTYVSEMEQALAIGRIADYNSRYLVITAFHPDTIEADLRRHTYIPVTDNIEAIHNGWHERIQPGPGATRGTAEYSWVLPPFTRVEGYEYKFCSIFEKEGVSGDGRTARK